MTQRLLKQSRKSTSNLGAGIFYRLRQSIALGINRTHILFSTATLNGCCGNIESNLGLRDMFDAESGNIPSLLESLMNLESSSHSPNFRGGKSTSFYGSKRRLIYPMAKLSGKVAIVVLIASRL